ncbi:MAG TPA: hypothetical protein DCZ20_04475 [Lachnospiraceae bacterium]|nr:hypothetical protein [Lachnospiraceae bacterium]
MIKCLYTDLQLQNDTFLLKSPPECFYFFSVDPVTLEMYFCNLLFFADFDDFPNGLFIQITEASGIDNFQLTIHSGNLHQLFFIQFIVFLFIR